MTEKPSFESVDESNPTKPSLAERTRTTNEAGGVGFEPFSAEFALYKVVLNNLLEDTYYDTVEDSFDKVWDAYDRVADENPEFVLKLASYVRNEEGLRDIPQLLLVLAANDERVVKPDDPDVSWVRDYTPQIIDRTDEFNTVLSYQLRGFGKPVPKGLTKGIEDALHEKYVVYAVEAGNTTDTIRATYIESSDNDVTIGRKGNAVLPDDDDEIDVDGEEALYGEYVDEGYVHDEYTFAKYAQREKEVSLHDVLNLVRPTPRSDDRDELFGRIAHGELDDHDVEPLREDRTWEATRSDDEDDRSEAEQWQDRLDDMGLMARVRNLRNMRQAGLTGETIFDYDVLVEMESGSGLTQNPDNIFGSESEKIVQNSQMFPFRFYQAYKACGDVGVTRTTGRGRGKTLSFDIGSGELLDTHSKRWLSEAIDVSTDNLPETLENTFTAIDLSGSMDRTVSSDSSLARAEIASLFGAMLMARQSDVGAFGSDFARVDMSELARANTSTLEIAERIYEIGAEVGNSTNAHKSIEHLIETDAEYDNVVIFTDMQVWDSTGTNVFGSSAQTSVKSVWDTYTDEVAPDADLFLIDLASYGDCVMPEGYHNVHQISGWSDTVIDYIDKYKTADDVIAEIETVDEHTDF